MKQTWDVFCKVVDNFGDVGVCWRLARQLAKEHGVAVRLWLDDLEALAAIWAGVDAGKYTQSIEGVTLAAWSDGTQWSDVQAADVVVEAFACTIPEGYVDQMLVKKQSGVAPRWINLEYLSAEAWVDGCHGMRSPQNNGLMKTFFFPGFTATSGGLLRENNAFTKHHAQTQLTTWMRLTGFTVQNEALKVVLFGYDHMPLLGWLPLLIESDAPVQLAVTHGKATTAVRAFINEHAPFLHQKLSIEYLPMLKQDDFDLLLWAADLNFIRGEDSLVRALWAKKPFIWHIYPQHDGVHLDKLEAFVERYCQDSESPEALQAWADLQWAWNLKPSAMLNGEAWLGFVESLDAVQRHAEAYCEQLCQTDDLAQQLMQHAAAPLA
ncbi:hypothetical protein DTO96_101936 [Ephemeroptericola cinctiostellae]|uniref:Protein-arginine rhamnosyltransferase n=1 Tax=Ephemeroptericola cinctiostellae TaxID=2268024 RepID=A0A345DCV2_9BURK|nr:elongation factor P maturation arginine rhamnosyltransferase EarP [Ephemeroptericola cinctiostellae]AXF86190.1 hypothetical protein DTO96_101936 [Ephemeroptericola cinctiostellae]